jgi:hypothetical protein
MVPMQNQLEPFWEQCTKREPRDEASADYIIVQICTVYPIGRLRHHCAARLSHAT